MNPITKVSDIGVDEVVEYCNLPTPDTNEQALITSYIEIAKDYMMKYTGVEDLDEYTDMIIVCLILVQDMWDNRALYVDSQNVNRVCQSILDLHSVNLL